MTSVAPARTSHRAFRSAAPRYLAGVAATAAAMVAIAGCVGALGAGSLISGALLALALLVHGCTKEHCDDYEVCEGGEVHVEHLCCPEGDSCNYGLPIHMCADGTCRQGGEVCSESQLDGGSDAGTDAGALADACCPAGMSCSFGMPACSDGG